MQVDPAQCTLRSSMKAMHDQEQLHAKSVATGVLQVEISTICRAFARRAGSSADSARNSIDMQLYLGSVGVFPTVFQAAIERTWGLCRSRSPRLQTSSRSVQNPYRGPRSSSRPRHSRTATSTGEGGSHERWARTRLTVTGETTRSGLRCAGSQGGPITQLVPSVFQPAQDVA